MALEALNRDPYAVGAGTALALEVACVVAERYFGSRWWFDPARWPTPDGYVPWGVFCAYWMARPTVLAHEALEASAVAMLPHLEGAARATMVDDWRRAALEVTP